MPAIPSNSSRPRACTVPVAIYSRVSTANQVGGRFDSCESQAAVCRDFIAQHAHDGWFEVACFSDPAYSGGSMNRPGIRALMRQIEAGEIKIVLIFKLERVLRSTDEWGRSAPFCQPRTRRSPLVPAPRARPRLLAFVGARRSPSGAQLWACGFASLPLLRPGFSRSRSVACLLAIGRSRPAASNVAITDYRQTP